MKRYFARLSPCIAWTATSMDFSATSRSMCVCTSMYGETAATRGPCGAWPASIAKTRTFRSDFMPSPFKSAVFELPAVPHDEPDQSPDSVHHARGIAIQVPLEIDDRTVAIPPDGIVFASSSVC